MTRHRRTALRAGLWRVTAVVVPVTLLASLSNQLPALADPVKKPPAPVAVESVPGGYTAPGKPPADPTGSQNMRAAPHADWPAPTSATVALTSGTPSAASLADGFAVGPSKAVGQSPLRVAQVADVSRRGTAVAAAGGPASVRVQVLDHSVGQAQNHPLVARITRADAAAARSGRVRVSLDYAGFRDAYGGDWANRLRLVALPECALTSPGAAGCQARPLDSINDPVTQTVSATVTLDATTAGPDAAQSQSARAVVALTSSPQSSSGGGDYGATALAATSSWTAGGQSGDFSWSYPMRTPEAFGGPTPSVGLSYSSQSLDGKTAATNNQPSWVGDGFDYAVGSIHRSYPACPDDGKTGVGDLCWGTDNATMSLPGHAGELIQVSTSPDVWKIKNDDGTKIERLTGATNGARNGEYWKVTTTDGVQYFFGLNRLPGWSSGKATTQSVFTVPVFGNNSGEPCHASTFANSSCQQAYEWNLDYVVDPHGNSMSMWYTQETNHYARNVTDSAVSSYTRGGHIDHIDYGTRQDGGVDSDYSAGVAPARVVFGTVDRCVTAGSTCTPSNQSNWPDVPWDQQCNSSSSCPDVYTPTFFTQKMLSTVTTQVWSGSGTTYNNVERWTLHHVFKDPGDGHAKTLWLSSISHAGLAGTEIDTPDITFNGVQLRNRVDTSASKDPIIRYRISSIVNEAGGVVAVTYSSPECVLGSNMPSSADSNTKRCYPVWWTPYGQSTATFDWFHKYVVTGVTVSDPIGGAPPEVYTYTYLGSPAWHYDDSEIVPADHKSWGQWRGYSRVRATLGAAGSTQQQIDTVYFRGMNGDKTSSGTRSVQIPADPDFGTTAIDDEDWRHGQVRETIIYNGTGDSAPVVSKTLTEPWEHGPTATRTRNGVTVNAYLTNSRSVTKKIALDGGRGWLTTKTTNTFDADTAASNPIGRIVQVDEANDTSTTDDDQCTTTTYASDPNGLIQTAVAEVKRVGVSCSATPDPATDVISDVRTWYDGATSFDQVVHVGDVTRTEQIADNSGSSPVYVTRSQATYDDYGRVLTSTDALGYQTSTAYTPASGSLTTSVAVTNPKNWVSTTTLDPRYGVPTSKVDPNGARTDLTYDSLGRLTAVWEPDRDKATQTASQKYEYFLGGSSAATYVATSGLNTDGSGYITTYQLYDGLLRKRQTQAPAVGGGALFTDTLYDSRGLAVQQNQTYYHSGVSWGSLYTPSSPVPGRVLTTYDHAGRASAVAFEVNGVEKWRTSTYFAGDHTDTTVPQGAQAVSTYMNAMGQTTELRNYHSNVPAGDYDATTYTYDARGNTATITDPAGALWQFFYDQRGRNIRTVDPDRGATTYTYDDADQQLTSTDARGVTLTSVYDSLGRVTDRYQGSVSTGTLLVSTTYDTLVKGQQTATTRYAGGHSYTSAITGYDAAYRPLGATITIPSNEGQLAGTYTTSTTYNADGSVATTTLPALGGLSAETISYGYNSLGMPTTLSGADTYVTGVAYDSLGRLTTQLDNDGGTKTLAQIWAYENGTNRLLEHGTYDNTTFDVYQDQYYTYDDAGNVTSSKDLTNQYGAGPDDNQCFSYDYAQRLTAAWTPSSGDCTTAPSTAGLGGPAPYWQSWTYDVAGDRLTQTDHTAAGDTTATSTYPAVTVNHPHGVTHIDTVTASGSTTNTYQYDAAGNTTSRAVAGKPTQTLTWDAEGHLASVADSTGTASYLYDAAGNRLIAHDSTGDTLYLGAQQLHISTDGTASATRFYGGHAVRTTADGLAWTVSDPQGTNQLTFKAADLSVTQRRQKPFGTARGTSPTWITDRGFVGGITDPTGLTQLGARAYDPTLGRFISVDPKFNSADPQAFNGYAYAHNNPTTSSDPSGLDDEFKKMYLFSGVEHRRSGGYDYYRQVDWYAYCRSDGICEGIGDYGEPIWVWFGDGRMKVHGEIAWTLKVPVPVVPPAFLAPKKIVPAARCFAPPPPPPPPPSCGFFDFKCGWNHPGWWWNGNKGWVEAGAAAAGIAACLTGVGCLATAAIGAGISAGDRTYNFVHNKEYTQGASAWGGLALGLGLDALGAIPGGAAAKDASLGSAAVVFAGRRGSAAVRDHLDAVRDEFLAFNADFEHIAGGRRVETGKSLREQAVWNPAGTRKRFPDLTFAAPDGSRVYINTVDTYRGGSPTWREVAAALDIAEWGKGPVIMIPKP